MIRRTPVVLCCLAAPIFTGAIGGHDRLSVGNPAPTGAAHAAPAVQAEAGTGSHTGHHPPGHDHLDARARRRRNASGVAREQDSNDGHDSVATDTADHLDEPDESEPHGHEGDEGLVLAPSSGESVAAGVGCRDSDLAREYDIVALAVDITLNRFGDHDPEGRMFALADNVEAVRSAEADGAAAVSLGLQGDVIQPLVLRVLPGECLRVRLTNDLPDEPASFHLHASSLAVAADGTAAVAANDAAMAQPGETVVYEWAVAAAEPEGTHLFHSHGDAREQSGHGLFGALVVEPPGSTWADPRSGEADAGWDAVVEQPDEPAFREFVIVYHEVGDEEFQVLDADDRPLPLVDPTTSAYRPGSRALNYRSEPFMNRLELGAEVTGRVDESLAYSSYSFGDPATPVQRTYVGDPVRERVVHAGPEVFHVHHVHGGSVRWRRQPGVDSTRPSPGLDKHLDLLPGQSERTDSQTIGPSETYDVEHECSSGGCQQGAGDYLVHCHVAHHYFAGMWGIWRVYNTLQGGSASTDELPPLPELADRVGAVEPGVSSDQLSADALARARDSLPPAGIPRGYDASVHDWADVDGRIVGEPETDAEWPGYRSSAPGVRQPILFDRTGRPAYPMLRPHLGARPPFAPGHGPAAYIDRPRADGLPSPPGADGEASLCPKETTIRQFSMRAVELPVPLNERLKIRDPSGVLFVLADDEPGIRDDPTKLVPLAVRANAGEHCVDVTLTNAVPDNADHPFSKISAHIHFMQFDVQSSDGVSAGFNFEQTLRPFAVEGARLAEEVPVGATRVPLDDVDRFSIGAFVGVGMEDGGSFEIRRIDRVDAATIVLDRPLEQPHAVGAIVSTEFLRQRWYPDVQVGTAYFHDHVNGIRTWQRGLVGAIVVEPPGSTYHDPTTGEEVTSGPIVDVHTEPDVPVSADISGSFREFVSFLLDPSRLSNVDRSPGASINLRAEPVERRDGPAERAFSSTLHGDPATPIVRAYVGDPLVVRATVGGTNEIHTWHLDGHWFRDEPWSTGSRPVTTTHLGISERKDLSIPAAGGPQQRPGDYMYGNGRALKLREGAWGLLRVSPGPIGPTLEPLPGHEPPGGSPPPVCPPGAAVRTYRVAAIEVALPMTGTDRGRIFVEAGAVDQVSSGAVAPTPLVLRATVGDCIKVTLDNMLPSGSPPVSLHADGLAFDPLDSGGIEAGMNPPQSVPVGTTRTFTFYAHPDYGPSAAMIRDGGDLAHSGALGLYGAIVVAPEGATFDDPTGWSTVVRLADGTERRDVVLFMHDSDDAIGSHRMPYTTSVRGAVGLNYGSTATATSTAPVVEAYAGDPIEFHVLAPWSEQVQVFSIEGHRWPVEPGMVGSTLVESIAIGGLESIVAIPEGGAGGSAGRPGTYQIGDHREPYREAGLAGSLVVHDPSSPVQDLAPLTRALAPAEPEYSTVPEAAAPESTVPDAASSGTGPPVDPIGSIEEPTRVWPAVAAGFLALAAVVGAGITRSRFRRKDRERQRDRVDAGS